jgi:hypothetical protein
MALDPEKVFASPKPLKRRLPLAPFWIEFAPLVDTGQRNCIARLQASSGKSTPRAAQSCDAD